VIIIFEQLSCDRLGAGCPSTSENLALHVNIDQKKTAPFPEDRRLCGSRQ